MTKYLLALLSWVAVLNTSLAQDAGARSKNFNTTNGVAIGGYDPVAYFKSGRAVKGNRQFSVSQAGVTYYFSSEANKSDFTRNPQQYEPQYGGWCAYAMGYDGSKVEIDPATFKITNGKLYLFYNAYFNNTLKTWNKDESNLKTKADKNWGKIILRR